MRAAVFTLILLVGGAASAATVYKWVDEHGVTHYSDQPQPGASKVQVQGVQTYASGAQAPQSPSAGPAPPSAAPPPPASDCAIESPGADEMFMNAYAVSGHVRIVPGLEPGERATVVLDGQPATSTDASGSFTLAQLERGTHTLSAQVETSSGQVRCRAAPVTFHVQQPSVQNPNNPNVPGRPTPH
jgi:hypothetical protein